MSECDVWPIPTSPQERYKLLSKVANSGTKTNHEAVALLSNLHSRLLMRGSPPSCLHFERSNMIAVLTSVNRWVADGDSAKLVNAGYCPAGIINLFGVAFVGNQLSHERPVLAIERQIAAKECASIAAKVKIDGR